MSELYLQPTPVAQWHALVNEAQLGCDVELGQELESYLVFMLMRFSDRAGLGNGAVAVEFLESIHKVGTERNECLQEVGDKCLLLSGFFPKQLERRRLQESYYIDLGQNAYYTLASTSRMTIADLYQNLCEHFVVIKDVMQAMRSQKDDPGDLKHYLREHNKLNFRLKRKLH